MSPKVLVKKTMGSEKNKIRINNIRVAKNLDKTLLVLEIGKVSNISFLSVQRFITKVGINKIQIYGMERKNLLKFAVPVSMEKKFWEIKWIKATNTTKIIADK